MPMPSSLSPDPVSSPTPACPTFGRAALRVLAPIVLLGLLTALAAAADDIGLLGPGADTGADTGTDTGADTGVDTGGPIGEVTEQEARSLVLAALKRHACALSVKDARVSLEGGSETQALAAACDGQEIRVAFTPDDDAMEAFAARPGSWVHHNACTLFEADGVCRLADCGDSRGRPGSTGACGRFVDLPTGAWQAPPADPARLYDEAMHQLLWNPERDPGWIRCCGCAAGPLDLRATWVLLVAGLVAARRRRARSAPGSRSVDES
ncbi:MAG: hypothetical protein JXB39_14815 [Deltaproteobacteria bacterium]|nr:hypothetical protein [Deltaproteobacteria bacterium]